MSINQIALLLQIVGFLCASVFIGLLKIEPIRKMLARTKQALVDSINTSDRFNAKPASNEGVLMILLLFIMILELPKLSASMRQRKQMTRAQQIKNLLWVYLIGYPLLIIISISILLLDMIDKMLVLLVKKMTGREVFTNIMIIMGSFLVFIGLIMEFIASYF